MKRIILLTLLTLGFHGIRHNISHSYLNLGIHHTHKIIRENLKFHDWNNNGMGA